MSINLTQHGCNISNHNNIIEVRGRESDFLRHVLDVSNLVVAFDCGESALKTPHYFNQMARTLELNEGKVIRHLTTTNALLKSTLF